MNALDPEIAAYTLSSLVAELCERAGIPADAIDVTLLEGAVAGFMVSPQNPAFTFIRALSDLHFFDPSSHDGVLHFVPRGGPVVMEIDEQDLLIDSDDDVQRRDAAGLPRVMHLNYYDIQGQLEPNKQTSDRSINIRGEGELSVTTPAVMTADDAAKVAVVSHKIAVEESRGERTLKVPDSYIGLVVADLVRYKGERLRVVGCEIDEGFQTLKLSYDRRSAYSSIITGVQPPAPPPAVSVVPGETIMEFIDTHILQSADDADLGFYFGITGSRAAWRGALIELSIDGGQNYIDSLTVTRNTVIGELTNSIGTHSRYFPDPVSTLVLDITSLDPELTSATMAELLNRNNRAIIGDEIIQFGEANQVSETEWELSYLLRGRLGTVVTAHSPGTRFVMLNTGWINYIPAELYDLGQALTFRATSLNSTTQTTITGTFEGRSHIERAPAYLRVRRDNGDIVISWIGVGRRGGRGAIQMSQYFTGYRVTVNGTPTDTQNNTLTVTDPGGAVTIAVQQINSIMGAGESAEIAL